MFNKELIVNYYSSKDFLSLIDHKDIKFKIYNKTKTSLYDEIGTRSNVEEIMIDNIGREAYCYLQHIINNYDSLAETNIFIQDDFNNHQFGAPDFFFKLEDNKDKPFYQFPSKYHTVPWVINRTVTNGFVSCVHDNRDLLIKEFTEQFQFNLIPEYVTETGAFFAVKKEMILKHSKEKYKQLMEWFLLDQPYNEIVMEHSWPIVFQ
jgi:hypothetical protein